MLSPFPFGGIFRFQPLVFGGVCKRSDKLFIQHLCCCFEAFILLANYISINRESFLKPKYHIGYFEFEVMFTGQSCSSLGCI